MNADYKKFIFGISSSGYHIEGNNRSSDWYHFEKEFFNGRDRPAHTNGISNDYLNKYKIDHDLLEELNIDVWRTSIEWSRIEPKEGYFDFEAVHKYKEIFTDIKRRKIKLAITLYHFVLPDWFLNKGGFEYQENLFYFERFAKFVLKEFKDHIDILIPLNEGVIYSYSAYIYGIWPPHKSNLFTGLAVGRNLVKAHFIVAELVSTMKLKVLFGTAEHAHFYLYIQVNPITKFLQYLNNFWGNYIIAKCLIKNKFCFPIGFGIRNVSLKEHKQLDFVGVQYYGIIAIKIVRDFIFPRLANVITSPDAWVSDFTFEGSYENNPLGEVNPDYLENILKRLQSFSKKKLNFFITETGISTKDNDSRNRYIIAHLEKIKELNQKGFRIIGLLYFTLCDSFEWAEGFKQSFGLVSIDRKSPNLTRTKKSSFHFFKEAVRKYRKIL